MNPTAYFMSALLASKVYWRGQYIIPLWRDQMNCSLCSTYEVSACYQHDANNVCFLCLAAPTTYITRSLQLGERMRVYQRKRMCTGCCMLFVEILNKKIMDINAGNLARYMLVRETLGRDLAGVVCAMAGMCWYPLICM